MAEMEHELAEMYNKEENWEIEKRLYQLKFETVKSIIYGDKPKYSTDIKMIHGKENGHPRRSPICYEIWERLQQYNLNQQKNEKHNKKNHLKIEILETDDSQHMIDKFNLNIDKMIAKLQKFILKYGEYPETPHRSDYIQTFTIEKSHRIKKLIGLLNIYTD